MTDSTTAAPGAPPPAIQRLLADFDAGRPAALARAVSIVENHREGFDALLAALHPRTGRARRIGITGPPGAGKSTLTTALVAAYRAAGLTVGVIAVVIVLFPAPGGPVRPTRRARPSDGCSSASSRSKPGRWFSTIDTARARANGRPASKSARRRAIAGGAAAGAGAAGVVSGTS